MTSSTSFARTDEERETAYRFRYSLCVEDQNLFMEQVDHERKMLHDESDETARILVAKVGGKFVGTARITFGGAEFDEAGHSLGPPSTNVGTASLCYRAVSGIRPLIHNFR